MQVAESTSPTQVQSRRSIKKVAVLGSGVMGSRIACHFANIGVEVLLLDIVPRELNAKEQARGLSLETPAVRNRIVNDSLTAAIKGKPGPLYQKDFAKRITTGNFDDDFAKIAEVDWVLEAIVERLDIKQKVFAKVDELRKPGTIVTSNTSGIPIHMMAEGRSEDFKSHFCGTHFFNPPRYLRLLEVIPGPDTDAGLVDFLMHYGDLFLGKRTVLCKDTPAFIANRIGIFAMAKIFKLVEELDLTIEEVDKLTGPASGKPKTGTFRLSDLVGLDTTVHVLNGIRENRPDDEQRSLFEAPAYVQKMVENKWLGDKTKQGFYKKSKDENGKRVILSLDLKTLAYREKAKVNIPSLGLVKNTTDLGKKMKTLFGADDKGGAFTRKSSLALWAYVSNRIPEIADNLFQIDDAMKAGFGWEKGPFEMWDLVGLQDTLEHFAGEGLSVGNWVQAMLDAGHTSFYKKEGGKKMYFDIASQSYKVVPGTEGLVFLDNLKGGPAEIWKNSESALLDLGDGVVNLEFRSKMNTLGEGVIQGIRHAVDYAEDQGLNGVVIANEGANFSVGANLMLILMMASQGDWDELSLAVKAFQDTAMRLRTSNIPVVVAPHQMTLGGGCEFTMHSDMAVLAAETYIGLVEVGVGIIPGGCGTKEMALRASDEYVHDYTLAVNVIQNYLMNIATAKVATSANEAREMGILRPSDRIIVNQDHRIAEAKRAVLEMQAAGYTPTAKRKEIPVLGASGLGTLYAGISGMQYGHYASEHDALIAKKIAYVMCGGELSAPMSMVSEDYLIELEREAFLQLCGERKTLERMQHMLQTGKPLRN